MTRSPVRRRDVVWSGVVWIGLTLCFGLIQLWIMLLIAYVETKQSIRVEEIIKDCGIFFFCTSLVTSNAVDFFSRRVQTRDLRRDAFTYVLIPSAVILVSVAMYVECYVGNPDIGVVAWIQFLILIMSLVYTYVVRSKRVSKKAANP